MKLRGNEQGGIKNASGLGEHLECSPCGDWRSMRAWASKLAGPEVLLSHLLEWIILKLWL